MIVFIIFYFDNETLLLQTEGIEKPKGKYDLRFELIYPVKKALAINPNPLAYVALCGMREEEKKYHWTNTAAVQFKSAGMME